MKIIKRLHSSENYQSDVNLFGNVSAKFSLQPFKDGWMSYVAFKYKAGEAEIEYYGNSLWGLDVMSKNTLIKQIGMYKNIQEVFNDFRRNYHESRQLSRVRG